ASLFPAIGAAGIFKDAVISIMATIAEQENIRRSARVRPGLARAKRQGARFGRPRVADSKASRTTPWRRSKGDLT
ncbi:MAG: hypothetical protein WBW82_14705, partial [Candidatus Sulfotelmatobacter sp.]